MTGITAAFVGARNPSQVKENVRAADIGLTYDEIQRINELLGGLGLQP